MREESNSLNGPGCPQFNDTVQIRKEMMVLIHACDKTVSHQLLYKLPWKIIYRVVFTFINAHRRSGLVRLARALKKKKCYIVQLINSF